MERGILLYYTINHIVLVNKFGALKYSKFWRRAIGELPHGENKRIGSQHAAYLLIR